MTRSQRHRPRRPPRSAHSSHGLASSALCCLAIWALAVAVAWTLRESTGVFGLRTVLSALPGSVAAVLAARAAGGWAVDDGAARRRAAVWGSPTGLCLAGLAAATACVVVGGTVRVATAGTEDGAVTASLVTVPAHAAAALLAATLVVRWRRRRRGRGRRPGPAAS